MCVLPVPTIAAQAASRLPFCISSVQNLLDLFCAGSAPAPTSSPAAHLLRSRQRCGNGVLRGQPGSLIHPGQPPGAASCPDWAAPCSCPGCGRSSGCSAVQSRRWPGQWPCAGSQWNCPSCQWHCWQEAWPRGIGGRSRSGGRGQRVRKQVAPHRRGLQASWPLPRCQCGQVRLQCPMTSSRDSWLQHTHNVLQGNSQSFSLPQIEMSYAIGCLAPAALKSGHAMQYPLCACALCSLRQGNIADEIQC